MAMLECYEPSPVAWRVLARVADGFSSFIFFTHDRAAPATLRLLAERVLPAFAAA